MVFYNLIIQAVVRIEKGPIGGSYLQGQRASLSCQVHGADVFLEPTEFQTQNFNPNEASITWFKNGKMIPTKNLNFGQKMSISVSKRISTLTISDLDGADTGYYQCVTRNSISMDVGTARITVETQGEFHFRWSSNSHLDSAT